MLCEYCNVNEGQYVMSNGKHCCESHYNKCPLKRKKNSEAVKGTYRNGRINVLSEKGRTSLSKPKFNVAQATAYLANPNTPNNLIRKAYTLLRRIDKCEICSCEPMWNNKLLKFDLDHIDGNARNNKIENLRLICPNCHSQTPTFRRKKKFHKDVTDNELVTALTNHKSIRLALFSLGLSEGRGNYARVKKLLNSVVQGDGTPALSLKQLA